MRTIKLEKLLLIGCMALLLCGCHSLNSRFGNDEANYANAKEMPELKFPPGSVAVSTRYDIPAIPGNPDQIITKIEPPNF